MKRAKRCIGIFFKAAIIFLLVTSILLSTLLGESNAEYFRDMSQKLDFEAIPDRPFEYYVYDADGTDIRIMSGERGSYKNAKKFSQIITVGRIVENNVTTNKTATTVKVGKNTSVSAGYMGTELVYQVKIPVTTTGYYNLNFTVDFICNTTNVAQNDEFFSLSHTLAVGCEVLNADDGFTFGGDTPLNLHIRNNEKRFLNGTDADKLIDCDSLYQWKTLAPSREETAKLAFKVEEADVEKGYVIWMWDLSGLYGPHAYTLDFNNVFIEKTMDLEGITEGRENGEPYFMFPQTTLVNNQLYSDGNHQTTNSAGQIVRGSVVPGKTSYSAGRGTFLTEATANSLAMQAETVMYGFNDTKKAWLKGSQDKGDGDLSWPVVYSDTYSNLISMQIPLKNVKFDTTYKVTFDFSIARQGTHAEEDFSNDSLTTTDMVNYAGYDALFRIPVSVPIDETGAEGRSVYFRSYLHSGLNGIRTINRHNTAIQQITYADKAYQDVPLTQYDDIVKASSADNFLDYITSESVNETYSIAGTETVNRNGYNAIRHTENNGQNSINWLTFYNTTFSFNIPEVDDNSDIKLEELYWTWAIDAGIPTCYYRIRLDNVRIEEVVNYGSEINPQGVNIGGAHMHTENAGGSHYGSDTCIFSGLRGANGTGQNYKARQFYESYSSDSLGYYMAAGNIYAPIVDASRYKVAFGNSHDYRIYLDGYCVCDGGVDKYVWSPDGGITWHDMKETEFSSGSKLVDAVDEQLLLAEEMVDQIYEGVTNRSHYIVSKRGGTNYLFKETKDEGENYATVNKPNKDHDYYDIIDFTFDDALNGHFSAKSLDTTRGAIYADLSDYKYEPDLNIIFAAVPAQNPNLRCEILRVINYNVIPNYFSRIVDIESDINVTTAEGGKSLLNAADNWGSYATKTKAANSAENISYNANGTLSSYVKRFTETRGMAKFYVDDDYNDNYYPTVAGTFATAAPGFYSRGTTHYKAYDKLKPVFSDIPVKTSLKIKGISMIYMGATGYFWTVDYGKTWHSCSDDDTGSAVYAKDGGIVANDLILKYGSMRYCWYDGSSDTYQQTIDHGNKNFIDSLHFDGADQGLTANLAPYAGQTVDVIFAASSNMGGAYCPIARIDNVAVYGDGSTDNPNDRGMFFTRLYDVYLTYDGTTYSDLQGNHITRFPTETVLDPNDGKGYVTSHSLSYLDNWLLYGSRAFSDSEASSSARVVYTPFEPANTNVLQARKCRNTPINIESGGSIYLYGYIYCPNGVNRYKASIDGGENWFIIRDSVNNDDKGSCLNYARTCNADFTVEDGKNGNFMNNTGYNNAGYNPLKITLPALPAGLQRELLVVAESNNANKEPSGKLYPVMCMPIKITNNNVTVAAYNARFENAKANGTTPNEIRGNEILDGRITAAGYNKNFSLREPTNTSAIAEYGYKNTARLRFTLPVSTTGEHTLSFNMKLGKVNSSVSTYTPDKTLPLSVYIVSDSDDQSYFNDISAQYSAELPYPDNYKEHIIANQKVTTPFEDNSFNLTFNVTGDDVSRGYICWDIDFTQLEATHNNYNNGVFEYKGFVYSVDIRDISFGTS